MTVRLLAALALDKESPHSPGGCGGFPLFGVMA